jgi:hypothetical protein
MVTATPVAKDWKILVSTGSARSGLVPEAGPRRISSME